jgi:hypothetical protein
LQVAWRRTMRAFSTVPESSILNPDFPRGENLLLLQHSALGVPTSWHLYLCHYAPFLWLYKHKWIESTYHPLAWSEQCVIGMRRREAVGQKDDRESAIIFSIVGPFWTLWCSTGRTWQKRCMSAWIRCHRCHAPIAGRMPLQDSSGLSLYLRLSLLHILSIT